MKIDIITRYCIFENDHCGDKVKPTCHYNREIFEREGYGTFKKAEKAIKKYIRKQDPKSVIGLEFVIEPVIKVVEL
jgi:hypothetical protein